MMIYLYYGWVLGFFATIYLVWHNGLPDEITVGSCCVFLLGILFFPISCWIAAFSICEIIFAYKWLDIVIWRRRKPNETVSTRP